MKKKTMPFKDKKKQRESEYRWQERNADKFKAHQRILWIARRKNPVKQKCSIDGCNIMGERHHPDYSKPEKVIWFCRKHHREIHRREKRLCSIKDCLKTHLAKGFCRWHYDMKKRNPKLFQALAEYDAERGLP